MNRKERRGVPTFLPAAKRARKKLAAAAASPRGAAAGATSKDGGGGGGGTESAPSSSSTSGKSAGGTSDRNGTGEKVGPEDATDLLEFTPLGAGNEVGRSCHILKFKGKTLMLDCGLHPAFQGEGSLPFLDTVELSQIDLVLITHFHVDHAGALPYLTERTDFKGKVFMTGPTLAILKLLLSDYVRINANAAKQRQASANGSAKDGPSALYSEEDLTRCVSKCELVNFHQTLEYEGIKFTCYNAGHVLGAAMFQIEIAGVRVFYTGDYSRDEDRHLVSAEVPSVSPDALIAESTFGTAVHESREQREARFTSCIERTVRNQGHVLLPTFAIGRAQELMLVLEDFWERHREMQDVNIYYVSRIAASALQVFETYLHSMNAEIRRESQHRSVPLCRTPRHNPGSTQLLLSSCVH